MKRFSLLMLALCLLFGGCSGKPKATPTPAATATAARTAAVSPSPSAEAITDGDPPALPEGLSTGEDGVPILNVFIAEEDRVQQMGLEEYLQGVLAGEMKNDWPMEALKAQAIIARTFVLRYLAEGNRSALHPDAEISTDVSEAQAYDAAGVNERIAEAVESTRGMALVYEGQFAYTWFFSSSGGITSTPEEGLNWEGEELPYLQPVESVDSQEAPPEFLNWEVEIPWEKVRAALTELGLDPSGAESITIAEKGPSGRVVTFDAGGQRVSAVDLRMAIGPELLRSTLIDSASAGEGGWQVKGRGFGHGVGLSQWGAYQLAEEGKTAEQILEKYYQGVQIAQLWS